MHQRSSRSFSPRELRIESRRRLPHCRDFVSKLWDVDAPTPRGIHVREGSDPRGSACALPDGWIILWAGRFDAHDPQKIDRVLIHELTHLVSFRYLDMSRHEGLCVAEGLASLATDVRFAEEKIFDKEKIHYFRGKRFIKALLDGGVHPHEMHPMLRRSPSLNDLFFPSKYLDRVGHSYRIDEASPEVDVKLWVELATLLGKAALGEHAALTTELHSGWLCFGPGEGLGTMKVARGMPRHLLHNPFMYGSNLVMMVREYLGGKERASAILKRYPPAGMVGEQGRVSHVIEPSRYLLELTRLYPPVNEWIIREKGFRRARCSPLDSRAS